MQSLTWQHARKHQTNTSPSKATHAFTKDSRFRSARNLLCDSFYNIPSSIGKGPASGIGRGNKTKIINENINTPSPQNYHVKSAMSLTKSGVKFGLGREKIKYNGIFARSETPEPGHYQSKTEFGTKRGFTIYSKLALPVYSNSKNPGPAQYNSPNSLNESGKYVLSQLTNCPGYKIKQTKQAKLKIDTPGPGHYTSNQNINPQGRYNNSRHENSRCRTFSRSAKGTALKLTNPGPGSYNYYSEFGRKD